MKSRTEELLSNSKIVLGAGKKLADVGAETIDIARDLYKIGAACKAYLEGKYDHFLDDLWKGLEEACEELGMVFSHPKEALEAKLKEQKEAIANSTPEDHGYLAMGTVLDFLGPAAIKKAGRVVKLAAKHIKAPGSFDLTKPTNGGIVEDVFSNVVSEALDGDRREKDYVETVRVGRWMSQDEYDKMVETGRVQISADNKVHVANPADIDAFMKQAPKDSIYVEFDVPINTLSPGGAAGWGIINGPGSLLDRLYAKKGLPRIKEMPKATNIEIRGRK